jgi:cell division protein FtsN
MSGVEVLLVVAGIIVIGQSIVMIIREKKCKSPCLELSNDTVQPSQPAPNIAQDIPHASSLVQMFKSLTPRKSKPQAVTQPSQPSQPSQPVQPIQEVEMTRQPSISLSLKIIRCTHGCTIHLICSFFTLTQ